MQLILRDSGIVPPTVLSELRQEVGGEVLKLKSVFRLKAKRIQTSKPQKN